MRRAPKRAAWLPLAVVAALLFGAGAVSGAPGDVSIERQGAVPEGASPTAIPPATFPHWIHRIQYRCYVCHPKVFEMKAGANEITMEKMRQGESCGACHNGAIAFGVDFQNCGRCHAAPQE